MTTTINGYPGNVNGHSTTPRLTDAWAEYSSAPFIAAHIIIDEVDEDLTFSTLGVTEEEAWNAFNQLTDTNIWPVFRIPLADSNFLTCVYRNLEDEPTIIDYLLEFGDGAPCAFLSAVKGDLIGPGISWPELRRAVYENPRLIQEVRDKALLFFIHMLGDREVGTELLPLLTQALGNVGGQGDPETLAAQLADTVTDWGNPEWTLTADGIMACDGEHSQRNPDNKQGPGKRILRKITRVLAADET